MQVVNTLKSMASHRPLLPVASSTFKEANQTRFQPTRYGAKPEDFAEIGRINHQHSRNNPYSQFQDQYTLEQIQASPMIHEPLTKLQCCPTSDGGAPPVLVPQAFLDAPPPLKPQAVQIAGQSLATDSPALFNRSSIELIGFGMAQRAAAAALAQAQLTPRDV